LGDKIDDLKDEAADKKGEKPADTDKKVSAD
jgi:hypothetical protein